MNVFKIEKALKGIYYATEKEPVKIKELAPNMALLKLNWNSMFATVEVADAVLDHYLNTYAAERYSPSYLEFKMNLDVDRSRLYAAADKLCGATPVDDVIEAMVLGFYYSNYNKFKKEMIKYA